VCGKPVRWRWLRKERASTGRWWRRWRVWRTWRVDGCERGVEGVASEKEGGVEWASAADANGCEKGVRLGL